MKYHAGNMQLPVAIEGRTQDRITALWGSEGSIAKNALDANTDCQTLLEQLKTAQASLVGLRKLCDDWRDDFAPAPLPIHVDELIEGIEGFLEN